jgi:thioredoxin 1
MSTLFTNLKHIASEAEFKKTVAENENLMIVCGRMGPMCVPVYDACDQLKEEYKHVEFYDMLFDLPDSRVIRDMPECRGFMGLPFTVYIKNGKVVKATSSIQYSDQITAILDEHFAV